MRAPSIALICLAILSSATAGSGAPGRPNVVLLLSHCLGYSDLGCYGGEIATPNLDALAAGGVRFANMHQNCSRTPSMAALISGQYAHRLGVIEGVKKGHLKTVNKFKGEVPNADLPALLAAAGYETFADGDHQGWSPENMGIAQNLKSATSIEWKQALVWKTGKRPEKATVDDLEHTTERSAAAVAEAIKEADPEKPFFALWSCRLSMYGNFAKDADVERLRPAYQVGHRKICEARYERLKQLGLVDPAWPWEPPVDAELDGKFPEPRGKFQVTTDADIIANPEWKPPGYGSNGVRPPKDVAEHMAIYAARTEVLDRGVGRILEALDDKGVRENTLVIFLALEGPDPHAGGRGRYWATCSGVPFHGLRRSAHTGAIITPMILSWPGQIDGLAKGGVNQTIAHLPDILPTVLAATGVGHPDKDAEGRALRKPDGRSVLPTLKGEFLRREKPLFFELIGHRAAITDDWRWINGRLYNMKDDRFETNDVAEDHPEVTARLAVAWEAWAKEVGARPEDYDLKLKAKAAKKK